MLGEAGFERPDEDVSGGPLPPIVAPLLSMVVPMGPLGGELTLQVHPGRLAGVDELSVVSPPHPGLLARLSGVLGVPRREHLERAGPTAGRRPCGS